LTGSLSLVDLKAIQHDAHMFWRLFETVKNFIQKLKIGPHETMETDRPRTIVSVKSDDTLEDVLKKLSEHRIHRIFVVDDEKKPIGCISLKDLLFEIISA
jgi:CBS domain-containing protein